MVTEKYCYLIPHLKKDHLKLKLSQPVLQKMIYGNKWYIPCAFCKYIMYTVNLHKIMEGVYYVSHVPCAFFMTTRLVTTLKWVVQHSDTR